MLHTGCHIPTKGLVRGKAWSHVGNTCSLCGAHMSTSNTRFRCFLGLRSSPWLPLRSTSLRRQKGTVKRIWKSSGLILWLLHPMSCVGLGTSLSFTELQRTWGNIILLDGRMLATQLRKRNAGCLSPFPPVQRPLSRRSQGGRGESRPSNNQSWLS